MGYNNCNIYYCVTSSLSHAFQACQACQAGSGYLLSFSALFVDHVIGRARQLMQLRGWVGVWVGAPHRATAATEGGVQCFSVGETLGGADSAEERGHGVGVCRGRCGLVDSRDDITANQGAHGYLVPTNILLRSAGTKHCTATAWLFFQIMMEHVTATNNRASRAVGCNVGNQEGESSSMPRRHNPTALKVLTSTVSQE